MSSSFAAQTPDLSPADWDLVHQAVQEQFRFLIETVQQQQPRIRSRPGSNSGNVWSLFSYCTFDLPADHAIDPVVVGVTVAPGENPDQVVVSGEIGGEESGAVFFETEARVVPKTGTAVLAAAGETARTLIAQRHAITDNLVQPCYPPTE